MFGFYSAAAFVYYFGCGKMYGSISRLPRLSSTYHDHYCIQLLSPPYSYKPPKFSQLELLSRCAVKLDEEMKACCTIAVVLLVLGTLLHLPAESQGAAPCHTTENCVKGQPDVNEPLPGHCCDEVKQSGDDFGRCVPVKEAKKCMPK